MSRPLHFLLGDDRKHWMTMADLAEYAPFKTRDGQHFSPQAAREWVTRHPNLPRARRGRMLVVDRATYDRYVMAKAEQKVG